MTDPNTPPDIARLLQQLDQDFMGWHDPEQRLVRTLERNELALFAQPILSLHEPDTIAMAEVLVRLREDEEVMLPPGGFLPLFDHFRLAPRLDRWVARQAVSWLAQSPRVRSLAINIAAQTLTDPDFLRALADELARAKLTPAALVLEIREQDALERTQAVTAFAAAARGMGCRLTLDGFGRRSVSLSPLETIRPDFVKVDGAIMRSLQTSSSARNKLGAIVGIAKAIRAAVIGGWVESAENLDQLRASGAQFAQGFHIQVPAPIKLIIGA